MDPLLTSLSKTFEQLKQAVSVLPISNDYGAQVGPQTAPTGKAALVGELDVVLARINAGGDVSLSPESAAVCTQINTEVAAARTRLVPQLQTNWLAAYPAFQGLLWSCVIRLDPMLTWAPGPPEGIIPQRLLQDVEEFKKALNDAHLSLGVERSKLDDNLLAVNTAVASSLNTLESAKAHHAQLEEGVQSLSSILEVASSARNLAEQHEHAASEAAAALQTILSDTRIAAEPIAVTATRVDEQAKAVHEAYETAVEQTSVISTALGSATEAKDEATVSATSAKSAATEAAAACTLAGSAKDKADELLATITFAAQTVIQLKKDAEAAATLAGAAATTSESDLKAVQDRLRIATSIGLAGAFSRRAKTLQWTGGIWALVLICALVASWKLGAQRVALLLPSLQAGNLSTTQLTVQLLLALFSVAAPVWLAWLATKQIGHNFKLAEDYGYKATISQAYEGYREEAINLDPLLQARLFSSALTRLDESPLRLLSDATPGSPFQELIMQPWFQNALSVMPEFKKSLIDFMQTASKTALKPLEKTNALPLETHTVAGVAATPKV